MGFFAGVHCVHIWCSLCTISILMSTVASWYVEVITTMLLLWLSLYQFITQQLLIGYIQKEVCVVGRLSVHWFHA